MQYKRDRGAVTGERYRPMTSAQERSNHSDSATLGVSERFAAWRSVVEVGPLVREHLLPVLDGLICHSVLAKLGFDAQRHASELSEGFQGLNRSEVGAGPKAGRLPTFELGAQLPCLAVANGRQRTRKFVEKSGPGRDRFGMADQQHPLHLEASLLHDTHAAGLLAAMARCGFKVPGEA